MDQRRPPVPPFDLPAALVKVQAAEDAWNSCDPHRVALAYTEDSVWRNRDTYIAGRAQIVEFLTAKGVTQEERDRTVANSVQRLPGQFETASSVLTAMMTMDVLKRPDNYYESLPAKYRAQTPTTLDQAARAALDPKGFTWIVVGDAAKVRPQLEKLGMPIDMVDVP